MHGSSFHVFLILNFNEVWPLNLTPKKNWLFEGLMSCGIKATLTTDYVDALDANNCLRSRHPQNSKTRILNQIILENHLLSH